jgi:ABC-type Na+ transport system ATPase subunit NatA
MIEATGLTKRLGGRTVVSDVTFRCEPGTVTGFLGPNGAGKTTTMRMLVGLSASRIPAGASACCLTRARSILAAGGAKRWPSRPR